MQPLDRNFLLLSTLALGSVPGPYIEERGTLLDFRQLLVEGLLIGPVLVFNLFSGFEAH